MAKYDMLLIHQSEDFTRAYGRAEVFESNRIDNPRVVPLSTRSGCPESNALDNQCHTHIIIECRR